ncbi:MAG: sulfatase-like hydrolase/transferase [Anaerolineae bacterium]|nr:sulfatase-like hydrolase/transferase [Anaerolineae bacterium]
MVQPNLVLIVTDTQATNVIGAYRDPSLHTPNIDRLAQTGIKFERAYTTCPLCTPARAGLFTGIYPHTAGAWTNNLPLGDNVKTMGQRLSDSGYRAAYIGKWHLDGHDYFGTGLCPDGWEADYWYDGANYLSELSADEIALWRRGLNSVDDLRRHRIRPEFTWAHRISDRALRFLNEPQSAPFLLVVSYDEPHHPFTCPPEYAERFLDYDYAVGPGAFDDLSAKPAHQREWAASGGPNEIRGTGFARHPLYFGCNSFVDAEIGRVIDAVHQVCPENTWLIFTSDHGDMLGAHQLGGKGPVMYEEITHIPLIVEPPGGLERGRSCNSLVSHIDLPPTLLELASLDVPPILEGESIIPLLNGQEAPDRAAVIEFLRYEIEHDSWGGFQPVRSIVAGDYKLAINLHYTDELYNLARDPAECENLIDHPDHVGIRNALHDRLLDWMYDKRDPFRGPCWERRPWCNTRRLSWRGGFRPRPADGYAPVVRDYDTGMPAQGVKARPG